MLGFDTNTGSTLHILDVFSTFVRNGGDIRLYLTPCGKNRKGPVPTTFKDLIRSTIESVCDVGASDFCHRHLLRCFSCKATGADANASKASISIKDKKDKDWTDAEWHLAGLVCT